MTKSRHGLAFPLTWLTLLISGVAGGASALLVAVAELRTPPGASANTILSAMALCAWVLVPYGLLAISAVLLRGSAVGRWVFAVVCLLLAPSGVWWLADALYPEGKYLASVTTIVLPILQSALIAVLFCCVSAIRTYSNGGTPPV